MWSAWKWCSRPIASPGEAATPPIARPLDSGTQARVAATGSFSSSSPSPLSIAFLQRGQRRLGIGAAGAEAQASRRLPRRA